jgi:hypothetical protein
MVALGNYYRDDVVNQNGTRGWPSGPQVWIAPDGIWQGTPINRPGTHGGNCNLRKIGMEIVGNYDNAPWQEPIRSLVYGALVALCRWRGFTEAGINGHRDCPSNKTCPGRAINLDAVRRHLKGLLAPPQIYLDRQVIGVKPSITLDHWRRSLKRNFVPKPETPAGYIPPLSDREIDRSFQILEWNDMDPCFFIPVWRHEGGSPLGSSPLQMRTHQPINVKATDDEWRPTIEAKGDKWLWSESFWQGIQYAIWHLKNVHGAAGRVTVRQIITSHAPPNGPGINDGNDTESFIASVLADMLYIQQN